MTDAATHTSVPINVEIVETSCGHCLKIGSADQLKGNKVKGDLPPYACIYVDYGKFAKEGMSFAARIVKTYNEFDEVAAELEKVKAELEQARIVAAYHENMSGKVLDAETRAEKAEAERGELLAALKECVKAFDDSCCFTDPENRSPIHISGARVAIAAAEGRS